MVLPQEEDAVVPPIQEEDDVVPPLQKGKAEVSTLQDSELTLQLPGCRLLRTHSEGGRVPAPPNPGTKELPHFMNALVKML